MWIPSSTDLNGYSGCTVYSTKHKFAISTRCSRFKSRLYACILQAIERHTTGEIDMAPLDMVLYCADALEPNRRFGRVDELRAQIGRVTLEALYVAVLGYWTILIIEHRLEEVLAYADRVMVMENAYAVKNEKPYINAKRKECK